MSLGLGELVGDGVADGGTKTKDCVLAGVAVVLGNMLIVGEGGAVGGSKEVDGVTAGDDELPGNMLVVGAELGVPGLVPVGETEGVSVVVTVRVPVTVGVNVGVPVGETEGVRLVVTVGVPETDGVKLGVPVGETDGVSVVVTVGVPVSDGVKLGVPVGVGVGVGVGEGQAPSGTTATADDAEHWITRTELKPAPLLHSGTRIAPSVDRTASIVGLIKEASVPSPSPFDMVPLPASVLTAPSSVTARTRWPNVSPTTRTPRAAHHTMPRGFQNSAFVPMPSLKSGAPAVRPASVVTVAVDTSTTRTRCDAASVTYSVPPTSARPDGPLSCAPTPTPSAVPAVPHVPAKVVVVDVANV